MTYPDLNITNMSGVFQYSNDITGGAMGWAIIIVMGIVMFGVLKVYPTKRAFMATMFFVELISGILYGFELLDQQWLISITLLFAMSALWVYWEDQT